MSFRVYALNSIAEDWNDDVGDFQVIIHCEVEQIGTLGSETFIVKVTGLKRLERWITEGKERVIHGHGYLIMCDYDVQIIHKYLQCLIDRSDAANWEQLSHYIEKYYDWID